MPDTLRHHVVLDLDIPITHEPTGEVRPAQIGESWWDALSCRVRTASTLAQVLILRKLPWPLRLRHVNWDANSHSSLSAYVLYDSPALVGVSIRTDGTQDTTHGVYGPYDTTEGMRDRSVWRIVTDEERKALHGPWPKVYRWQNGAIWRFDGPDDEGTHVLDDGSSMTEKPSGGTTWAQEMAKWPGNWTLLTDAEVAKLTKPADPHPHYYARNDEPRYWRSDSATHTILVEDGREVDVGLEVQPTAFNHLRRITRAEAERIVPPKADRRAETCEYGVAGCCGWLGSVAEPKPPWIGPVTAGLPDCRNCPCWKPKEPQGSDAL